MARRVEMCTAATRRPTSRWSVDNAEAILQLTEIETGTKITENSPRIDQNCDRIIIIIMIIIQEKINVAFSPT